MAIWPPMIMASNIWSNAAGAPLISSPTSKPSFIPSRLIRLSGRPRHVRPATTSATSSGELEAVVGLMSVITTWRAPTWRRDRRRHDADRPGAGDQHVLADEIEGERGMDGVAERIEDRAELVIDVVGQRHDVERRDLHDIRQRRREC